MTDEMNPTAPEETISEATPETISPVETSEEPVPTEAPAEPVNTLEDPSESVQTTPETPVE